MVHVSCLHYSVFVQRCQTRADVEYNVVRRTGTSYFGYCSDMHLPDRVDLVIVEFDTEDPQ